MKVSSRLEIKDKNGRIQVSRLAHDKYMEKSFKIFG